MLAKVTKNIQKPNRKNKKEKKQGNLKVYPKIIKIKTL